MLTAKTWDKPAFGSQSLRFNLNGVHPNLYATGKMPYDTSVTSKTVVRYCLSIGDAICIFKNFFDYN